MSCLVLVAAGAGVAQARARFKTGIYTAVTSQGAKFKFDVVAHTRTNHCGSAAGQYCFLAKSYPTFEWVCAGVRTNAGIFSVPSGFVKASTGAFKYAQALESSSPLLQFTAVLSGSRASGSFRQEEPDNAVPGTSATCDSGTVTWKAKTG